MTNKGSIGIFDSGVGGLSVAKHIFKELPEYDMVYFGDTARVPYGTKSQETITKFEIQDSIILIEQKAELIIIGCNTVSSVACRKLKKLFAVPILDIINPVSVTSAKKTVKKKIGVIGTSATINSHAHKFVIEKIDPAIKVFEKACPLLVSLAENPDISEEARRMILREYLDELVAEGIDVLILGCTHYSHFIKDLNKLYPKLYMADPGYDVAREAVRILKERPGINEKIGKQGQRNFFVSDQPENFNEICNVFLGETIKNIKKIELS